MKFRVLIHPRGSKNPRVVKDFQAITHEEFLIERDRITKTIFSATYLMLEPVNSEWFVLGSGAIQDSTIIFRNIDDSHT